LLKKDAVRASATASSVVLTVALKLPADVGGAFGSTKTPKTFPSRSVTAIAIVETLTDAAALSIAAVTSEAVSVVAESLGRIPCIRCALCAITIEPKTTNVPSLI
jgi:hypothetical protein